MEDTTPPKTSSRPVPVPPSEREARLYYAALRSQPTLVARSSVGPWETFGPDNEPVERSIRPGVGSIRKIWDDQVGRKIRDLLGTMKIDWTSIDLFRVGINDYWFAPVVVWIGVTPGSLSGVEGVAVVRECTKILDEYDLNDVEVEIHEAEISRPPDIEEPTKHKRTSTKKERCGRNQRLAASKKQST